MKKFIAIMLLLCSVSFATDVTTVVKPPVKHTYKGIKVVVKAPVVAVKSVGKSIKWFFKGN